MSLASDILAHSLTLGFDCAAVLSVQPPRYAAQFAAWLAAGYHGEMAYMAARAAERLDPTRLAADAASMIVVAANYNPGSSPQPLDGSPQGRIARYARWPDYHDVIKPQLFALDAFIRARTGRQTLGKAFVDSAPVLERDFAEQAGLGFIGRNTCLIAPGLGSWTVLAGLMVPEDLTPGPSPARRGVLDSPTPGRERGWEVRCGRCTRCLDACPTRAFVGPHVLDARRCISYLTIELRGPIPRDLRPLMGDWVFGCDVCQEVCPYNRGMNAGSFGIEAFAGLVGHARSRPKPLVRCCNEPSFEQNFQNPQREKPAKASIPEQPAMILKTRIPVGSLSLAELLALDGTAFRACFRGTPVLRAKRRGLVRNACVAAGNSRDPSLVPFLVALLSDAEPLVRGHAAWALGQIGGHEAVRALVHAQVREPDLWVREEIASAVI